MKLILKGNDARYAVEQSLLAFFPQERPVYDPAAEEENEAVITLSQAAKYTTAVTALRYGGRAEKGISRVVIAPETDEYEKERLRQRAVKLSFFKAAQKVTGVTPTWGALTGIRPAKLAAGYLEQGMTPRQVNAVLRDTYSVSKTRRELCIQAAQMVKELGLNVKSFYMGGGTPTTLSADQMDRLLTHLNRSFDLSGCAEYCIEAGRPDTIDREKLRVLLDHGCDRISVNPQSLEDGVLQAIGRRHTAADIEKTMALAMSMGFSHVNMDLIAGLPADTPEGFRRTLDKCLSFGADNITVHTLALKKGSRILLEGQPIPSAEAVGEMLDYSISALRSADFHPYYLYRQKYMSGSFENIGWCISGAEGLYNIYIMEELHSILSLGAGGSTKMVDPAAGRIERVFHAKYPNEYITRPEKIQKNLQEFSAFYRSMKK